MMLLDDFYVGQDYRFSVVDDLGLACLASTAVCLYHDSEWATIPVEKRALVFSTYCGSQVTDQEYQKCLDQDERTSPRVFVQTLPNMAAGQVAACFSLAGEHLVLVQSKPDFLVLENIASLTLNYGDAAYCLLGWMEYTDTKELTIEISLRYAGEKDHVVVSAGLTSMARS
jgi:hypothetical protein